MNTIGAALMSWPDWFGQKRICPWEFVSTQQRGIQLLTLCGRPPAFRNDASWESTVIAAERVVPELLFHIDCRQARELLAQLTHSWPSAVHLRPCLPPGPANAHRWCGSRKSGKAFEVNFSWAQSFRRETAFLTTIAFTSRGWTTVGCFGNRCVPCALVNAVRVTATSVQPLMSQPCSVSLLCTQRGASHIRCCCPLGT